MELIKKGKKICPECKVGILKEHYNQSITTDCIDLINVTLIACEHCKSIFYNLPKENEE